MSRTARQGLEFSGFGPSFLNRSVYGRCGTVDLATDRIESRGLVRLAVPAVPGVYGWIGEDRRLIYVGKSKSLRHRLLSYFAAATADPKMERIRRSASRIVWQPVGHELLALLREQELIHRWRPEFNSMGQPHRRLPAFVVISDTAAPHASVTRRLSGRALRVYGPITGAADLRESVAALNHVFQLRDCPDRTRFSFGEQLPLFDDVAGRALCLRQELGSCPAPCAAGCTRGEYQRRVDAAIAFLEGRDATTLARLEEQMKTAAAALQFERASIHCQQWRALGRLHRQLGRLRWAEQSIHGVLEVQSGPQRRWCLVFSRGRLVQAWPVRVERECRSRLLASVAEVAGDRSLPSDDTLSVNLRLIVATWFRRDPGSLRQVQSFPDWLSAHSTEAARRSA